MEWGADVNEFPDSRPSRPTVTERFPSSPSAEEVSLRLLDTTDHPAASTRERLSRDLRDEAWLQMLLSHPAEQLVYNVRTRWSLLRIGDVTLPITRNETDYDNSYVCSPYTACVLYPQSEACKLPGYALPTAVRILAAAMGLPLKGARFNRVISVNNWLLSTNLYSSWNPALVPAITRLLTARFPTHAITWRSVNEVTNRSLMRALAHEGYWLAPSRQVYFFDGASRTFLNRPNTRRDLKLLETTRYQIVGHDALRGDDVDRIEYLYRLLYIKKYSPHNPQFTAKMLEYCRRHRLLTMWGLRNEQGRLDGIVGAFERDGVMTVPLVGYDTSLPQTLGLYRLLMALVLREAADQRWLMNLSSGAAEFKRLRGGVPCLEMTAVFGAHLSWGRRAAWQTVVSLLRHVAAPLLRKYQL